MATTLLYLYGEAPMRCLAQVIDVGHDQLGMYLVLDQTCAYVRGGGQLGDRGCIGATKLLDVRRADGEVRHYVEGVLPAVGVTASVNVDPAFRQLSSRWHTAGHLLAAVLEREIPGFMATAAQHWPTDAWVTGPWCEPIADGLVERVQRILEDAIATDVPVIVELGEVRAVAIQGHRPVPCGGTHVTRTGAIGHLQVEEVRVKKGVLKARYVCKQTERDAPTA